MSRLDDAAAFVVVVLRRADEHDVKYPAAAFAYYGFVSFLPVLILAVALLGETYATRIAEAIPRLLTPRTERLVNESLATASGRTGATVFATLVLAWSGANMTVVFQTVVERVEGIGGRPRAAQLRDAGSILGSLCLAIGAVVFTELFVAFLSADALVVQWRPTVLFVTLVAAFLPLYYVPSQVLREPTAALPGALTAAGGWVALVTVVQFYAANAAEYALYGILSGVVLVLTSLYLAAAVLMLGVVVNVALVARS